MRRIGVAIAVAVLLVLVAVLSWNLNRVNDELSAARSDRTRVQAETTSLSKRMERAAERAAADLERSEAQLQKARDRRRRLRTNQQCSPTYVGHVWLFPEAGPVGTRVRFVGDCFVHEMTDSSKDVRGAYGIFLSRQLGAMHPSGECEQIVGGAPFDIRIKNGRAEGFFTVQSEGSCFQQRGGHPVVPGKYSVGIGCHACA